MSYNPNIPMVTDPTLQSFFQLRANFQAINNTFSANHTPLDRSSPGMHSVLTLNPQMGDPTTAAMQMAIYNKLDANNVPSLFFRPQSDATPIQLTYDSVNTAPVDGVYPLQQYSFIAGPFIVYAGAVISPSTGHTVTLSPGSTLLFVNLQLANLPFVSSPFSIMVPNITSGTTFSINYAPPIDPPFTVYYFAIGM